MKVGMDRVSDRKIAPGVEVIVKRLAELLEVVAT